jgi:hypothetical protein
MADETAVVTAEETGADVVPDAVAEAMVDEQAIADAVPQPIVDVETTKATQARVYVCERGHRTNAIWRTPTVCQAKPLRSGPICGRPLYPIGELPEQVQKALNPLKASKKASKKG